MMRRLLCVLAFVLVFLVAGCANRAALYTEQGLVAAERVWAAEYSRRLEACEAKHEPLTPGAEQCFGPTYDLDAEISVGVRAAVVALRTYWTARAGGGNPSWREAMDRVRAILDALPPEVREQFKAAACVPLRGRITRCN